MKKIVQLSMLFLVSILYGQSISGYQYIYFTESSKDFNQNKYGLRDLLISRLKAKKYIVLKEKGTWPQEANNNPCEILKAEYRDTSNIIKNKVALDFTDCNDKKTATFEGKSSIKDIETGMKDALEMAVRNITFSVPTPKENPTNLKTNIAVIAPQTTSTNINSVTNSTSTSGQKGSQIAEIYSNGVLSLNKVLLSNGEFILVNPNNSVPYGIFKPSTKKDTYRVQMSDGNSTLGYMENGKIIIELTNSDGSLRTEVFEKK